MAIGSIPWQRLEALHDHPCWFACRHLCMCIQNFHFASLMRTWESWVTEAVQKEAVVKALPQTWLMSSQMLSWLCCRLNDKALNTQKQIIDFTSRVTGKTPSPMISKVWANVAVTWIGGKGHRVLICSSTMLSNSRASTSILWYTCHKATDHGWRDIKKELQPLSFDYLA